MGFRLSVTGGAEQIALDEKSVIKVDFDSASAVDSNARATDFGISMKIWGKMLISLAEKGLTGHLDSLNGQWFLPKKQTATETQRWK